MINLIKALALEALLNLPQESQIDTSDTQVWEVFPLEKMEFDPEMESFKHSIWNYFDDVLLFCSLRGWMG